MIVLWIIGAAVFWMAYYRFTHGAITRHIGFLHFAMYFFAIYIGGYVLYVENGGVDKVFALSVFIYPLVALLGMLIGQGIGRRTTWYGREIRLVPNERTLVLAVLAAFFVAYAAYLYSLGDAIPLVQALQGESRQSSRLARYMATKGYSGDQLGGIRILFWLPRIMIDYFASFVIVFAFYWTVARKRGYLWFLLVFGVLVAAAMLQLEKYPAIKLLVMLGLCYVNFRYFRITARSALAGIGLIVATVVFSGFVYGINGGHYRVAREEQGVTTVGTVSLTGSLGMELLATRGLLGQTEALRYTYQLVPDAYEYFGGTTLPNPHGILPYQQVMLPFLVNDFHLDNEPGVQGSDPTVFFGEIYANWGFTISMVAALVFGIAIQVVNNRLSRNIDRAGTAFDVAFFYLVALWIGDFSISFNSVYLDERFWFFIGLCALRGLVSRRRAGVPVRPAFAGRRLASAVGQAR